MVLLRSSICVWGLFGVLGSAQAAGILDVYDLARDNDPKYKAAHFEFQASEQVLEQARAGFWPTIRLDLEKTRTEQRIIRSQNPIFGTGTSRFPTDNHTLSITQPIFRKDVIERLEQAHAIVRQAHFALLAQQQDLLVRVANAYLSVLAANDSLELARAERAAVRKQLDLAESRLKSGLGSVTSLYDAAARHAIDQAREIEAENKLADARQALREITGISIDELRPVRDPFALTAPSPANPEPWVETAQRQNYALRARAEGVLVAAQEIERQRAGYFPSLNLLGNRNYRDAGSTLFGGGSTVMTTDVTLRLSVPIYEGGLTKAQTAEARARHQRAIQEQEAEWRALDRQTRAAFQSVVSGVSLVDALSQSVVSQQKALEGKETGARAGLFTVLNVLDAQRDLYLARRDYAQARYDYLLNRLKLKQNAGLLAQEDLALIEQVLEPSPTPIRTPQIRSIPTAAQNADAAVQAATAATPAAEKSDQQWLREKLAPKEFVIVEQGFETGEVKRASAPPGGLPSLAPGREAATPETSEARTAE